MLSSDSDQKLDSVDLDPQRFTRTWYRAGLAGILLFGLADHFGYHTNFNGMSAVQAMFNMGAEDSLGGAFGILLTMVAAVLAWIGVIISTTSPRRRAGWLGVAVLLTAMAVDDAGHVHERIGTIFRTWVESDGAPLWFPSYAWQVVVAPIYGLLTVVAARFLWIQLEPRPIRWAPVGAFFCWVVAVGIDFIEGLDAHAAGHPYSALLRAVDLREFSLRHFDYQPFDMLMHYGRLLEESLETLAVVLFGAAVIWLLTEALAQTEFRPVAAPKP
ncbi:MAG: hypothetical protein GKS06_11140 [Acidobacteria bacterium]|nr:hypothetical protein [Acidobacteriota bacterium]